MRRRRRRRVLIPAFVLMCVSAAVYGLADASGLWNFWNEENPTEIEARSFSEETAEERKDPVKQSDPAPSLPPPEESCDDLRVLVGKNHGLPPDYQPENLSSLRAYGVPAYGGDPLLLRRNAIEPLEGLVSAAASDGQELLVLSAYRSYAKQRQNFAHFTGVYGEDAEEVSAPPGQSQHQLGTTVDFTNAEVNYELLPAFGETSASKWLEGNAWKHGFIITYPNDDKSGTGRQWEPWEYRYVGADLAKRIHESGLSLRKFLTEEGVRPLC